MAVTFQYDSGVTVEETLASSVPAQSSGSKIIHNGYNTSAVLNASSTPPATKAVAIEQALTAGAATVDLTSLTGTNGASVDGTGLKVQCIKLRNKATNSNPMTIVKGAATGYDGFGAAFSVTLAVGAEVTVYANDNGSDISGTNKHLDLSGTLVEVAELVIVMG